MVVACPSVPWTLNGTLMLGTVSGNSPIFSLDELVKDGVNGLIFKTSAQLAEQLEVSIFKSCNSSAAYDKNSVTVHFFSQISTSGGASIFTSKIF